MPSVPHATLTGADLHEPKGADAATANLIYVSDGGGSGTWKKPEADALAATGKTYGSIVTADGANAVAFNNKVWKDIIGVYQEDVSGPTRPTKAAFRGSADAWAFGIGDAIDFLFHMPHDYALGTDLYIHVHWGHVATAITGGSNLIWQLSCIRGNRTATVPYGTFGAPITPTINSNSISGAMTIANFPQYCHVVEEIQLSSSTPSATQFDSTLIRPDDIIVVHASPTAIPGFSGGTTNEPFLFTIDIHYQADLQGTKNKDPNFYA